jgi:predicted nicotinamide N-methyase
MEQARVAFWNDQVVDWETELSKLQQSYQLKQVDIEVNGQVISLVKVTNIDDLLDRANDPDEIPFWAELWPSSIGLTRHIFQNKADFEGKTVLELGSGVGLAGIAAKIAGSQVVQSDFTIEALRFTRANCLRNLVSFTELLLADWRNFPISAGCFDWIIGADILYEENLHGPLTKIFKHSLKPGGALLLADPGRNYGKKFIRESARDGWRVAQSALAVFYEERTYNIDIYQLQPGGTG